MFRPPLSVGTASLLLPYSRHYRHPENSGNRETGTSGIFAVADGNNLAIEVFKEFGANFFSALFIALVIFTSSRAPTTVPQATHWMRQNFCPVLVVI